MTDRPKLLSRDWVWMVLNHPRDGEIIRDDVTGWSLISKNAPTGSAVDILLRAWPGEFATDYNDCVWCSRTGRVIWEAMWAARAWPDARGNKGPVPYRSPIAVISAIRNTASDSVLIAMRGTLGDDVAAKSVAYMAAARMQSTHQQHDHLETKCTPCEHCMEKPMRLHKELYTNEEAASHDSRGAVQ